MNQLAVYDFDKTVYLKDSATDFWKFIAPKYGLWKKIPKMIFPSIGYFLGRVNAGELKTRFFSFIEGLEPEQLKQDVDDFWREHKNGINPWVYQRMEEEKKMGYQLFCISASPVFLLEKFTKQLGFDVFIGTHFKVDHHNRYTGEMATPNCKGFEKVKRLNQYYDNKEEHYFIKRFYSDSQSDMPLYDIAEEHYYVKHGKLFTGIP